MNFIKKLSGAGTDHVNKTSDKRIVLIINCFSLVLFAGAFLLILIRTALYYSLPGTPVMMKDNINIVIGAFLFLLPLVLNRFGYIQLAKLCLCWFPSIIIIALYISNNLITTSILTSQYESIYFFLLGVSAVPYLILDTSNKKEMITCLSAPFLLLIFCDYIIRFFGVEHSYEPGFEITRMRIFVAYLTLSGCCLIMKMLVEKQEQKNEILIKELEEKNKIIDHQAEKAIKESESKYRLLFEQAADAITLINADKIFEEVNSSACEMFGYSHEEFLLLRLEDVLDKDALKTNPLNLKILDDHKTVRNERILKRKNGSIFPAEVNVKKLPDGNYQSFIHDITNRKKAEREIIEAEEKFRTLVEKSLVGVYIIKEGKYAYVNPQFAQIFGYTQEELTNSYPVETVVHADDREKVKEYVRVRIEGEVESIHYEACGQKKNGDTIQMEVFGSKTIYEGKPAIIGTLMDTTENKLLQQQVLNQKIQEQKKIVRAMLNAEEKERNRIGQELHDNITQILAGTKLFLGLAAKDEFAAKGLINTSRELLDSAIEEMRSLSKSQVTPIKAINLKELINSLVDKLNTVSSIKTTVLFELNDPALEDDLKLNIYRIIQEQTNNILKHANASNITISLKDNNGFLYILIEDDGDGFDPSQKRNGIGLYNINDRVEAFNGTFHIDSSPGNGCRVKIKIPY